MERGPLDLDTCGPQPADGCEQTVKISLEFLAGVQRGDHELLGLTLAVLSGKAGEGLAWTYLEEHQVRDPSAFRPHP